MRKIIITFGLLVIILGILGFIFPEITYVEHKALLEVGPFNAHINKEETFKVLPLYSTLTLGAGLIIVILALVKKKKRKD